MVLTTYYSLTLFVTNTGFPPICDWTTRRVCGWLVSTLVFKRSFIAVNRVDVCYKFYNGYK